MDYKDDFYWEVNGEEYRVIHESEIDELMQEEIKDLVEECYLSGVDLG